MSFWWWLRYFHFRSGESIFYRQLLFILHTPEIQHNSEKDKYATGCLMWKRDNFETRCLELKKWSWSRVYRFYRGGLVCFRILYKKIAHALSTKCQRCITDRIFSDIWVYLCPQQFLLEKRFLFSRLIVSSTRERLRINPELKHLCVSLESWKFLSPMSRNERSYIQVQSWWTSRSAKVNRDLGSIHFLEGGLGRRNSGKGH